MKSKIKKKGKNLLHYITFSGWILVVLSVLVKVLCGLLPAIYIRIYTVLIDTLIVTIQNSALRSIRFSLVCSFSLCAILNYYSGSASEYLSSRLQVNLSTKLRLLQIEQISKIDYCHIENKDHYDLICRVRKGTPDNFVSGFFAWLSLGELILRIVSIVFSVFVLQEKIALIMLVLFVPMIFVSLHTGKQDYAATAKFLETWRRLENYENVLTAKEYACERALFRYQNWFIRCWKNAYLSASRLLLQIHKKSYLGVKLSSAIITLSCLAMVFSLVQGVIFGTVSVGSFSAVSAELLSLSSNLSWSLSSAIMGIARCREFMRDVRSYEALPQHKEGTEMLPQFREIKFQNVWFRYPGTEHYILKNFNLTIDAKKSYAIVGANGAGKTTVTKLLLGLYHDYEGEILLDGIELRKIGNLSHLFSVAFQDFAKYQITIRENIVLSNSRIINDQEILELLNSLAFSLDSKFTGGLDTPIGYLTSQNMNISIGQWQKLILARAILHGGQFFLLDEPTASLDPSAESEVYNNFLKLTRDKPSVIVTHRLGAARLADCILVIDNGKITEKGSHDELVNKGGLYTEMFKTQKGWYE